MEKLEWCNYPKVKKFDDMFRQNTDVTDGQTNILQQRSPGYV